jgi:hypothetical protein
MKQFFFLILVGTFFVKISKKLGVMQKPAAHRENNFIVLSFFYGERLQIPVFSILYSHSQM